jgi:hypothetical protein
MTDYSPNNFLTGGDPGYSFRFGGWINSYQINVLFGDTVPAIAPVVEWLSPAPGTAIDRVQAVTVRITDLNLVKLIVSVRFAGSGWEEVIFRAGGFADRYVGSQAAAEPGGGYTLTIRRLTGWPSTPTFSVDAADSTGEIEVEI